jgi:hypothetical protein
MEFSTISLPRERDQVLMEIFFTEDDSPETIRSLGRCRGALEAIFLSDVTTADGQHLEKIVFGPGSKNTKQSSNSPMNVRQTRIGTHGSTSGTTLH